jgi:hypothetical protein
MPSVNEQKSIVCGPWMRTSHSFPPWWNRSWQCPRRWWSSQCSGKVSRKWWVPCYLHLFPEPQSLRAHMIVPHELWHLLEFLWGSRVTDLQAANAYLFTTSDLLESYHKLP